SVASYAGMAFSTRPYSALMLRGPPADEIHDMSERTAAKSAPAVTSSPAATLARLVELYEEASRRSAGIDRNLRLMVFSRGQLAHPISLDDLQSEISRVEL